MHTNIRQHFKRAGRSTSRSRVFSCRKYNWRAINRSRPSGQGARWATRMLQLTGASLQYPKHK
eukprot:1991724-Heterocapsa_arctica.AAC.1